MRVLHTVSSDIVDSFRVAQVASMFDVDPKKKLTQTFDVEVPGPEEDWQIGAIIGPSGSGKSTVAAQAYPIFSPADCRWGDGAVIDAFDARTSATDITSLLTAVGFSTPPSWLKPYRVLSNGEKFRCELARALLNGPGVTAFDEFTSLVDRQVAQVCCTAVAKAIRKGRVKTKLVAVSCHSDVVDFLEPDWVLDMASGQLVRGSVRRRPPFAIEIHRAPRDAWRLFAPHHYLDASLHHSAQCYVATHQGRPAAFCATLSSFGHPGKYTIHRVVCLPDFQGIGVGRTLMNWVARMVVAQDFESRQKKTGKLLGKGKKRISITSSSPAVRGMCSGPEWRLRGVQKLGYSRQSAAGRHTGHTYAPVSSIGRPVATFDFVGP